MIIYDASDLIVGRLSSKAAKDVLLGREIVIVNCEKSILSGSKETIMDKFQNFKNIGKPFHGPFTPRMPDRIVRRSIKRMLPHKVTRGREAFKRVMCYIGIPNEFKNKELKTIDEANVSRLKSSKYMKLGDVSRLIGKYDK
jgi:large subunit ribosomal protein L13